MTTPNYFEDLKNDLDLTWEDEQLDKKLLSICKRAEKHIESRVGHSVLFDIDMDDQNMLDLLYNCIRYIRANARDEFDVNYADELNGYREYFHTLEVDDEDL